MVGVEVNMGEGLCSGGVGVGVFWILGDSWVACKYVNHHTNVFIAE